MSIFAFIIAVVAAVIFGVEASRPRPFAWLPLGLCLLTVALIVQFCHPLATIHF